MYSRLFNGVEAHMSVNLCSFHCRIYIEHPAESPYPSIRIPNIFQNKMNGDNFVDGSDVFSSKDRVKTISTEP